MLNRILAKLKIKNLHKVKSFSILIIPTGAGVESKTHHLSSGKAFTFVGVYTLIVFVLGFLLISVTPVKRLIFPGNSDLSPAEKQLVTELNQKMLYLSNELQNLRLTNEQLRNAIMLGDSALIDSITNKSRSSNGKGKNPYGGDIFLAVQKLFSPQQASSEKLFYFTRPIIGFISRGFNPEIGHM